MARRGRLYRAFFLVAGALVAAAPALAEEPSAAASKPDATPACLPVAGATACIDALEFTNARFVRFLAEHGNVCDGSPCYDTADPAARLHEEDGHWAVDAGFENHPVTLVTWHGAKAVCEALGSRLCTPKEWTLACVGPKTWPLPYGPAYDPKACNGYEYGRRDTLPVGSLPRCQGSAAGLFDLSGNVWEWTAACEKRRCQARGGSYNSYGNYLVCEYVDTFHADIGEKYVGFRCCR